MCTDVDTCEEKAQKELLEQYGSMSVTELDAELERVEDEHEKFLNEYPEVGNYIQQYDVLIDDAMKEGIVKMRWSRTKLSHLHNASSSLGDSWAQNVFEYGFPINPDLECPPVVGLDLKLKQGEEPMFNPDHIKYEKYRKKVRRPTKRPQKREKKKKLGDASERYKDEDAAPSRGQWPFVDDSDKFDDGEMR